MVVRIPRPEDDRFPWSLVTLAIAAGLSLGLGLAAWGMDADRARDAASPEAEDATTPDDVAPAHETIAPAARTSDEHARDEAIVDEGEPDEQTPMAETEPTHELTALAPEPTDTATPATPAPTTPAPAIVAPTVQSGAVGARVVTLREGRVAYLRCDGLPPQRGPFPCPRDEALERAVWSALHQVERCGAPPRLGHADVVVDLEGTGAPTIRARDTFPSDTARTDDMALLACVTESLSQVRSVLRARRLVVSFRLVLEAPTP